MFVVSAWGRRHIDADTRIRARTGTSGLDYTMGKKTALVYPPLIGVLVVISTLALDDSQNREPIAWVGAGVCIVFLLAHQSSVRRAAR